MRNIFNAKAQSRQDARVLSLGVVIARFTVWCPVTAKARPDEFPGFLAALRLCAFALILDCMATARGEGEMVAASSQKKTSWFMGSKREFIGRNLSLTFSLGEKEQPLNAFLKCLAGEAEGRRRFSKSGRGLPHSTTLRVCGGQRSFTDVAGWSCVRCLLRRQSLSQRDKLHHPPG